MVGYSKTLQLGKPVKTRKAGEQKKPKTDLWAKQRARLKVIYESRKITSCEYVDVEGHRCGSKSFLTFAHIDKRRNTTEEETGSFYCTLLLCIDHHQHIENDKEETDRLFKTLR